MCFPNEIALIMTCVFLHTMPDISPKKKNTKTIVIIRVTYLIRLMIGIGGFLQTGFPTKTHPQVGCGCGMTTTKPGDG